MGLIIDGVITEPPLRSLICYCEGNCPPNARNGTCTTRPGGFCYSSVEEVYDDMTGTFEEERMFGCIAPKENGGFLMCKMSAGPHVRGKNISCCDSGDMCNRYLSPIFISRNNQTADAERLLYLQLSLCVLGVSVLLFCFGFCVKHVFENRLWSSSGSRSRNRRENSLNGAIEMLETVGSGSGAGLPLLVQRTIAKQIQMVRSIGKGRYGEVWLANWRDEKIAVKTFYTSEEASWIRETEIYQALLIRHENILGYLGADIKDNGSFTQLLLITDYHENGSLYDYLCHTIVSPSRLQLLAYSIASGLAHLHTEICGTPGKVAIAHRDIKSKNILVKRNGQCAIADFGLAIKSDRDGRPVPANEGIRVGTKRYMAPEVLSEKLNRHDIDDFKRADIYSMGLVLWEMTRRCSILQANTDDKEANCEEYVAPYSDVVPNDPTYDEMFDVVCLRNLRPPISQRWRSDLMLTVFMKIMQECWHKNPSVRPTAFRLKKTLARLAIFNDHLS